MDTSALTREQLEDRLVALHRASLELVRDISPEVLMERIATLACEQVSARMPRWASWTRTASWKNSSRSA